VGKADAIRVQGYRITLGEEVDGDYLRDRLLSRRVPAEGEQQRNRER
jgi:hypothetical protein